MEDCIKIRRYEELLTSKDFESLIEAQNVPAVIKQTTLFSQLSVLFALLITNI